MILCVCPNPSVDTYWWLEEMKTGDVNRIRKEELFPGGKGLHVALAAAELGEAVTVAGIWAGATGQWLQEQCRLRNVVCEGITVAGQNRTCITVRSETSAVNNTEFLGTGPLLTPTNTEALLQCYQSLLPQAHVAVLSGSWPPGAGADAYGAFIDAANQAGVPVWLDCSGSLLVQALAHRPFGLHVNHAEAAEALPAEYAGNPESYFLSFVQQLALTAGKKGLYLSDRGSTVHAACVVEQVYSTVGSGDCLVGGLAVATARGYALSEAARLGTACGSANCMCPDLGLLCKEDVDFLLPSVALVFSDVRPYA